jgi:UDP-2-acetamido-3-amino-2,3-dideoxy-glucuronate N-acetyltransferase
MWRGSRPLASPDVPDFLYKAHPTSVVEEGARIGAGTQIWHHAHIRKDALVGESCVLGKNVYVDAGAVIGDRTKIQNNVSVYAGVELGNDVFVGPSAVFTNDRVPRAFNADWRISTTVVGQGASVGANATIVCGNSLGDYCMVAAGSTVTRSVAPYELVAGNPARHLGWVCICGTVVSRAAHPPEDFLCSTCDGASR